MWAKIVYQKWKSREVTSIKIWINSIEEVKKMELLTSLLDGGIEKHMNRWSKWEDYKQSEEFKILME